MQRLFSTFADGWPGLGLLLQRILTAILLVRFGIIGLAGASFSPAMIPDVIAGCAGILFLVGLWTPVVGTLIAVAELWIAVMHAGDPWMPIVVATLSGTAARLSTGVKQRERVWSRLEKLVADWRPARLLVPIYVRLPSLLAWQARSPTTRSVLQPELDG